MILRNLAHITHLIYFFTGTAAGTWNGHEPLATAAYQGSSRCISEAKTEVQPHKTRFIAYHYASLRNNTHHYTSLLNSSLIITHHYSSLIKQHYSSLRTITLPQRGEKFVVMFEDFMPQNYAYSAITHENRGGGCPPRFLCVMMSKKEIYE